MDTEYLHYFAPLKPQLENFKTLKRCGRDNDVADRTSTNMRIKQEQAGPRPNFLVSFTLLVIFLIN